MPSTTSESVRGDADDPARSRAHARRRLTDGARRIADNLWGDRGARIGLAAHGVVYLVLAYLVARIALAGLAAPAHESKSKPASGPGVAQVIASQTGGRAALFVLGTGLLLYTLFSALDAVLHHNDETPATKRWGDRLLSAWGAVLYSVFGGYCVLTAVSGGAGRKNASHGDQQQRQWSADVLRWSAGWLYLGLLGTILLVIAAFLVSRCVRLSFAPRLDRDQMERTTWRTAMVLGVLGYLGRAGLFAIVGWFVLAAAVENDPQKGQGFDGSARNLADSAAGPYLLWALAALLGCYCLYMFLEARYRKV